MAREPAGWLGRYQVAGRPELGWGECRVLDVSPVGVGLELFGPWPRDGVDAELLVCLDPLTDPEHEGTRCRRRYGTPAPAASASCGSGSSSSPSTPSSGRS